MHKPFVTWAGSDTAKGKVDVVRRTAVGNLARRVFANTRAGHRQLRRWLGNGPVRVVVEASGIYSLDSGLALPNAEQTEIMALGSSVLKDYRRCTMERSKTYKIDAAVISDYAWRGDFVPWQPSSEEALNLRQIAHLCRRPDRSQEPPARRMVFDNHERIGASRHRRVHWPHPRAHG